MSNLNSSQNFNINASTADFEFEALRHAHNYRRLLIGEFAPYLKGNVLEIGAGIGQMTGLLQKLLGLKYLLSVEPDPKFCAELRKQVPGVEILQGMVSDVSTKDWNSIVSINVLEHIEADEAELKVYHELLRPNKGVLALFVPARQELFADIDKDFGHYRRYGKKDLIKKLERAGFKIEKVRYFDFVGYFAWWLNFRLIKGRKIGLAGVRLFDTLIFPPEHFIETRICRPPIGKNLLLIARAA